VITSREQQLPHISALEDGYGASYRVGENVIIEYRLSRVVKRNTYWTNVSNCTSASGQSRHLELPKFDNLTICNSSFGGAKPSPFLGEERRHLLVLSVSQLTLSDMPQSSLGRPFSRLRRAVVGRCGFGAALLKCENALPVVFHIDDRPFIQRRRRPTLCRGDQRTVPVVSIFAVRRRYDEIAKAGHRPRVHCNISRSPSELPNRSDGRRPITR